MDTRRRILVFGKSAMLGELASTLRVSPLLDIIEGAGDLTSLGNLHPAVILVDAAVVIPEQFSALIAICPVILSVDPDTYQLTILSFSHQPNSLADLARVIGLIALCLPRATEPD